MKLFCIKELIAGGIIHFTKNEIYETKILFNKEHVKSDDKLFFEYNAYKNYFITSKEHRNNILKKLGI